MILRTCLLSIASLLIASTALAASDVIVDISQSPGDFVYDVVGIDVTVSNIGNKNANSVVLTIELPETNTSPNVYVMGDVQAIDSRCTQGGSVITCSLGKIRKNKSKTRWLDIVLPQVEGGVEIYAEVETSSSENDDMNNDDLHAASLQNYVVTVADGDLITNEHCTGMDLTSFYECVVSPGSISTHDATYHGTGSGTISFSFSNFTGLWSQPSPTELEFTYFDDLGEPVAEFHGYGVPGDCFEGVTTFPGSPWVAPYSVCLP